ncbi:MAG: cyclic nucleotide-binding domain-containing protein [Butyrivibrio sp.]|nr:cyclic nucleotide-binding domain-containing protein [Butyrivibrio sp.]
MGQVALTKGTILHKGGKDTVETLEIVTKGAIKIYNGNCEITAKLGSILGTVELPGENYTYTYEALEDSVVFSYNYSSTEDIFKVVKSNPKIASILASAAVTITLNSLEAYNKLFEAIESDYNRIKTDYQEYNSLCISVGETPKEFPEINDLEAPEHTSHIKDWVINYFQSLHDNEDVVKKGFYALSADLCNGIVMHAISICNIISNELSLLLEYKEELMQQAGAFIANVHMLRTMAAGIEKAMESGDMSTIGPAIVNALDTILTYAGADDETTKKFKDLIIEFKKTKNRYDSSDEARTLRRSIGMQFYNIYIPAFYKSLDDPEVPIEVKMFLMFGFVDEELAGAENTIKLYNILKAYMPDPNRKIVTVYEWLQKIYNLEVEPSRNEFDQDYAAWLRELKINGEITAAQVEEKTNDPKTRFEFEVKNLFTLGNRMTFGRISSFVPIFDSENVLRPLDTAYLSVQKLTEAIENLSTIDFSLFARQKLYSNKDLGINQLYIDEVITPYIILLPNVGSRASLWQEIEGKKRSTPARMLISIFNTENLEECLIKLFAEYRWEMCKTIQGVHWNDVTDPSLTSQYCDYLQFYKKNSSLSAENKEKIKTALQKNNNNYKNVFIGDYMSYIKFELNSSPRLNKLVREIIFTYCPFNKEIRDKMSDNPQFSTLISHYNAHQNGKIKPVVTLAHKLQQQGIEVPQELIDQVDYLKK